MSLPEYLKQGEAARLFPVLSETSKEGRTTVLQQYMVAVGMGLAGEDDAAIAKVYARNAGLALPGEDAA